MENELTRLKLENRRLRNELSRILPSLDLMLARRGFRIYKSKPSEDLLLPEEHHKDIFYEKLKKYSFRLFLRDVIKHQDRFSLRDVSRYSTQAAAASYIDFILKAGIAEMIETDIYHLKKTPIKSFGETLEWFTATVIEREFSMEAIWGVKFRRPDVGGDYDLIAKVDSGILYMEVKSSPPKQIQEKEISAFLDRFEDLSPDISVFFVDTELRMKDKIVPMFESALEDRYKKPYSAERILKELFHLKKNIYIINAKGGIQRNIEKVLHHAWRSRTYSD